MALTLEATLVIPLTMAITVGILSASIHLYENTKSDARMESTSFMYALDNKALWSCVVNNAGDDSKSNSGDRNPWSKKISVNPVKERNIITLLMDTASGIKDILPVFNEMEGLLFENTK